MKNKMSLSALMLILALTLHLSACASVFTAFEDLGNRFGNAVGNATGGGEKSNPGAASANTSAKSNAVYEVPTGPVIDESLVKPAKWMPALSIPLEDTIAKYKKMETENKFTITSVDDPIIKLFDQTAGDYIVKELTTDKNLKNEKGINTTFYFFWSPKGNMQVHLERTLTDNRKWQNGSKVWTADYGFNDSNESIGHTGYGADATYFVTPGMKYDTDLRIQFLENMQDPEFASIAEDVHKVAYVTDYDFEKAYGLKVKFRNNGHQYGVCDDYSDTLFKVLQQNPNVKTVRKITGQNHAWIECDTMKSGKTIYCDATWYDTNSQDAQGYVVDIPRESLDCITYDKNAFEYKGTDPNTGTPVLQHIGTVAKTWTRK
ncbi:MAG: hypothetical protein LBM77_11805 [Spirochaetaceae bacterium]|jgi:hypothetical protein|nr:hypothetical protein [Spirochaetaceae bacterium]